jgi:hypothetical protein
MHDYQKNYSVVCTDLDDGAVLLDLDTKYYFNLNETGRRIWQLMDECNNASEIAERLCAEYDVGREKAIENVANLIEELTRESLITSSDT